MESKKWTQQFHDSKRELLISILIVEKYLSSQNLLAGANANVDPL